MPYRDQTAHCQLCGAELTAAPERCVSLLVCRACHRGRNPDALIARHLHVQTLEQRTITGEGDHCAESHALGACAFELPLHATFGREGFLGRRLRTDLQTGDALFDDAISVGGDDRELLPALLQHEPVRLAIMDLVGGAQVQIVDGIVTARATTSQDVDELRRAVTVVAWGMAGVAEARALPLAAPRVLFASELATRDRHTSLEIHGDRVDLRLLGGASETPALAIWDARLTAADLSPLLALPALRSLQLVRVPEVRDLTPLGQLTELTTLVLAGCPVRDVAPLAQLGQLRALNLARTQVEDLRPLAALRELRELYLEPMRIDEQARALQRQLPTLQIRGDT